MTDGGQASNYRTIITEQSSSSTDAGPSCFCLATDYVSPDMIRKYALQNNNDKRELQDLNERFNDYLRRLKALEEENRRLQQLVYDRQRQTGFESAQAKDQYDADLQNLRKQIDSLTRDKAREELHAKRDELDALTMKNRLNFLNRLIQLDTDRLVKLRQKLEDSQAELQSLGQRVNDRAQDLERSRNVLEDLYKTLDDLKNRFDHEALARVVAENELQTLDEEIAFRRAIYEEERNEATNAGFLPFDNEQFYRVELSRAINLIKSDFEELARQRRQNLDEYYNYKTNEFRRQVQQWEEQNRQPKDVVSSTSDPSSLHEALREEKLQNQQMKVSNSQLTSELEKLQSHYDNLRRDKERAEEARRREYELLCNETRALEHALADVIDNNVSLQSDIGVYRRLLEIQPDLPLPRAPSPPPEPEQIITEVRSMTVQKTSQGPLSILQVDPDGHFIVVENGSSGAVDLTGWTVRRSVDRQPDIVYRFPDSYTMIANQRVRLVSRSGRTTAGNARDALLADSISTWGAGDSAETRILDQKGAIKAYFKQSFA